MRISTAARGVHKDWDFEPEIMASYAEMADGLLELTSYLEDLSGDDEHHDSGGPLAGQLESLAVQAFTTGKNQQRTWAISAHEDVVVHLIMDDADHAFAKRAGLLQGVV